MHCLQVECWAETKLVKTSKCLEPRENRQAGRGGSNIEATLSGRHGLGRVPWMEDRDCRVARDPEALPSTHCREPETCLAPCGFPSGGPRQQAGLTEVPSASAQGCESLCAPRWRRTERGGGGRAEGLFHETLEQLPVNTLGRGCQSKQHP